MEEQLIKLWEQQAEWSQKTFGNDNIRGPVGPLAHLAKETEEITQEYENYAIMKLVGADDVTIKHQRDKLLIEFADAGLLLIDSLRRSGFNLFDLIKAMEAKQKINMTRSWPKLCSTESTDLPVFHINDGE